ncbi:uncharacterized protein [Narcine bancroftii]|uniref:uncharacterized protein n=1 Tax=Narcine bancroftii TaxID=1343680 RepID=UPI0038316B9A
MGEDQLSGDGVSRSNDQGIGLLVNAFLIDDINGGEGFACDVLGCVHYFWQGFTHRDVYASNKLTSTVERMTPKTRVQFWLWLPIFPGGRGGQKGEGAELANRAQVKDQDSGTVLGSIICSCSSLGEITHRDRPIAHEMFTWMLLFLSTVGLNIRLCGASGAMTYTYTGGICATRCAKQGLEFYWCYKHGGDLTAWDYCSPISQVDYTGSYCSSDCVEGLLYDHWCSLEKGGWSFCSKVVGC